MKTKFTLLITAALFLTVATQAQGYNDHGYAYNNNRHEIGQDRKAIYRDDARINQEKHEVYHDIARGDYRDVHYDRFELNRGRVYDRHELQAGRRDARYYHRVESRCF